LKSLASKILKGVAGGARLALPVLKLLVPGSVGVAIDVIGTAIIRAENQLGSGSGAQKAQAAAAVVAAAAPRIVEQIELSTGRELADEDMLAHGLGQLQQGTFSVLKAFRLI